MPNILTEINYIYNKFAGHHSSESTENQLETITISERSQMSNQKLLNELCNKIRNGKV